MREWYLGIMRKTFVIIISVIMIALVIVFTIHEIRKPGSGDEIIVARHGVQAQLTTSSFVSPTHDSNVVIYTSPNLGVRFKFAIIDPANLRNNPSYKTKNTISETDNTIMENDGSSISVFDKQPTVSLYDIVQKKYPDCKIQMTKVSDEPLDIHAQAVFPDYQISYSENGTTIKRSATMYEATGDPLLTTKDQACFKEAFSGPVYYAASSSFLDRYISVTEDFQAASGVLYLNADHPTSWMSTVEFIPKQ